MHGPVVFVSSEQYCRGIVALARFPTARGYRDFLEQVLRFSNLNRSLWFVKMRLLILVLPSLLEGFISVQISPTDCRQARI
jgi:hypothetical protein